MLNGCWFDPRRADHFFGYVDKFATLTEGAFAGQKFELQNWQREHAGQFFGWVKHSAEWGEVVRRFRYWYTEIPKKNGKTPFAATLGLYLLIGDSARRQTNVHVCATTKKQAEKLILHASRQIPKNRHLDRSVKAMKKEGFTEIHYKQNVWNCLTADEGPNDGINGHIIADEIHRWKGKEYWNTLRWALASHPEGAFIAITTAGQDMQGLCRDMHDKTNQVNSGRQIDQTFLGVVYGADKDDDPHEQDTWFKANPSLGTDKKAPLKLSTFREDYETAKADPTQWPAWLQLRLNIWRSAESSWLPIELWDAGKAARGNAKRKRIDCYESFGESDVEDWVCTVAFDGATVRDTTAAVFAFEHPEKPIIRVLPYFWLPQVRAEELGTRVPFQLWHEQKLITLTQGDAVDFETIFQDLTALIKRFQPEYFYFDPMFQAEYLTQRLEQETDVERLEFPQTIMHFTGPTKTVERMIYEKSIRHNGHPVLSWQLGQTMMWTDPNQNKRPKKHKHGDIRTIDGVVAMIMAMKYWQTDSDDGSYYDDQPLEMG